MRPRADNPVSLASVRPRFGVGRHWLDARDARGRFLPLLAASLLALQAAGGAQAQAVPAPAAAKIAPTAADEPKRLPSARECFDQGQADYFAGRLSEARHGFECAYQQLPSPELLWNLARVSERMGDVESGLRYFREYLQVAKLSPKEKRGIQARINALQALGERQAAVLKLGPEGKTALGEEARTFFERGAKLYRAGHYKAAAAAFTAALQLSEAPELHYNLAVAAEKLGAVGDACDHYRAYLEAFPGAPDREVVAAKIDALRANQP